jgi:hypothetical protein
LYKLKSQPVFVLDCKKAFGSTALPWSLLTEKSLAGGMVRLYAAARMFFQGQNPFSGSA